MAKDVGFGYDPLRDPCLSGHLNAKFDVRTGV